MPFNIEDFKARGLVNGGARPTAFEVVITDWPGSNVNGEQQFRFLCKATQIPTSFLGQIEVPYFGRTIKVVGDRNYANWNVTIINDIDYNLRTTIEQWHQNINQHVENIMGSTVSAAPASYKRDAIVRHMTADGGRVIKTYTVKGIFPTQIDAMTLDWDMRDQIQMFDVEFSVDYWLPTEDSGRDESTQFAEGSRNLAI